MRVAMLKHAHYDFDDAPGLKTTVDVIELNNV
jgi:hypothetical protein